MKSATWWQRIFANVPLKPVRRRKSDVSTRLMDVEVLEDRVVPVGVVLPALANIYVTGNVTNSIVSSDPARFNDGAVSPLIHLSGNNYLAKNLRSAVADAATTAVTDNIFLDTGTYSLANGELKVKFSPATSLTITNRNHTSAVSTIDANNSSRIFEVYGGGATTLDHLNLTNGNALSDRNNPTEGGAILNRGNLTLTNDQIVNNHATGYGGGAGFPQGGFGGGVFNGPNNGSSGNATLTVKNTLFDSNTATGGSTSRSFANGAGAEGGAIALGAKSGAVSITASTFNNNQAIAGGSSSFTGGEGARRGGTALGGAIEAGQFAISVKIVNSTFYQNSAYGGSGYGGGGSAYGGALGASNQNTFELVNDTVAFNNVFRGSSTGFGGSGSAYGGGMANFGGTGGVKLLNTILAKNSPDDLFGSFTTLGHNLIGNVGTASFGGTAPAIASDLKGSSFTTNLFDPSGLQNNGGPTQTLALLATAKAINAGDNTVTTNSAVMTALGIAALSTDQRGTGFPRKINGTVDIGAYEFQLNLDKFYAFQSGKTGPTSLTVPAPGLLAGNNHLGLTEGQYYQAVLFGSAPPGVSLTVNFNGSFTLTVPANFRGLLQFRFKLRVTTGFVERPLDTNLIFTATIQVTAPTGGRGSASLFLGL